MQPVYTTLSSYIQYKLFKLPIVNAAADKTAVPCTHYRCAALFPGHSKILYNCYSRCTKIFFTYDSHVAHSYCVELQHQKHTTMHDR